MTTVTKNSEKFEEDQHETFHYELGKYELSFNPINKYQFFNYKGKEVDSKPGKDTDIGLTKNFRYSRCMMKMQRLFNDVFKGIDFELFSEISMPHININNKNTWNTRIHFHGVFVIKRYDQLANFLLYGMPLLKKFGNVNINEYREKWEEYVRKNRLLAKAMAKSEGMTSWVLNSKRNVSWKYKSKTCRLFEKELQNPLDIK